MNVESFLTQLVSDPARGCALLDLLVENREGLVGDVIGEGHSNHKRIEFSILAEIIKEFNKTTTLEFWRMNFNLFRALVQRIP